MEGFPRPQNSKTIAKPCLMGPLSRGSAGHEICEPWSCSSALPGPLFPKLPPLRPAQSPPDRAPKACQSGGPQAFTITTRPQPSGLHNLAGTMPLKPTSRQSTRMISTPPATPGPHSKGPLVSLKERPMPVGPWDPTQLHRRAPNLPKTHTQTGLDAKGVTSEQLRLHFYCSITGDFFFFFFLL
jgi:hypothetical protein